jgi:hypothetical protein
MPICMEKKLDVKRKNLQHSHLYNIPLVIFYLCLLCVHSVSYAPLSIKPFTAALSKKKLLPVTQILVLQNFVKWRVPVWNTM